MIFFDLSKLLRTISSSRIRSAPASVPSRLSCVMADQRIGKDSEELCQTIVVSGGDFDGVYEFYSHDVNGHGMWSTAGDLLGLYFVPQGRRRRRLSEDGDHGEFLTLILATCCSPRNWSRSFSAPPSPCMAVSSLVGALAPRNVHTPFAWLYRRGRTW